MARGNIIMANREDLIRELYEEIMGSAAEEKRIAHQRLNSRTQSLVAEGGAFPAVAVVDAPTKKKVEGARGRYEVILETDDYSKVLLGYKRFLVMPNEVEIDDTIVIRETSNLVQTGNSMIKTVAYVEKDHPGIADGYRVISWK